MALQPVGSTGYTWHPGADGGATYIHPDGSWTYVSNSESTPGGAGSIIFAADGTIIGAPDERVEDVRPVPNTLLPGLNVAAVEVHQSGGTSSDMAFKLKLNADQVMTPPAEIPEVSSPVVLAIGAAALLGAAAVTQHLRPSATAAPVADCSSGRELPDPTGRGVLALPSVVLIGAP